MFLCLVSLFVGQSIGYLLQLFVSKAVNNSVFFGGGETSACGRYCLGLMLVIRELYCADKSLTRPGRKQANVSVRMA